MSNKPETTHFGFTEVPVEDKVNKVAEVFHSVAGNYDIMNDVMSMGIHRFWKKFTMDQAAPRAGHRVLDLAGGTGDLAKVFARKVGKEGEVVLADINSSMLTEGRRRMADAGIAGNIRYAQVNAECLPFPDDYFDIVTIAFGLRNVTDKDAALRSINRVIKPGGKLLVLEFSKPTSETLSKVYDTYSFKVLPLMGKLIANDEESYRYLAESIRMHPDQDTLKGMMEDAGFSQCNYHNLTGGVVALHKGFVIR